MLVAEHRLAAFRAHIQSYRDGLQLSLQTIILANQVSHQKTTNKVLPSLDMLHDEVRRVARDINHRIEVLQSVFHWQQDEGHIAAMSNLRECIRSSASIVSSASTAAASEDGDQHDTILMSDFGDCFPPESKLAMRRWIATRSYHEYDRGSVLVPPSSIADVPTFTDDGEGSESDSDLENEITSMLLESGRAKLEAGHYDEAEKTLHNCLSRLSRRPTAPHSAPSSKETLKRLDVVEHLCDIYRQQSRWSEVEKMLNEKITIKEHVTGTKNIDFLSDIATLADTLRQKGDLAAAEVQARRALKGYKKLDDDDGTKTCLALLIELCEATSDDNGIEAWNLMLAKIGVRNDSAIEGESNARVDHRESEKGTPIDAATGQDNAFESADSASALARSHLLPLLPGREDTTTEEKSSNQTSQVVSRASILSDGDSAYALQTSAFSAKAQAIELEYLHLLKEVETLAMQQKSWSPGDLEDQEVSGGKEPQSPASMPFTEAMTSDDKNQSRATSAAKDDEPSSTSVYSHSLLELNSTVVPEDNATLEDVEAQQAGTHVASGLHDVVGDQSLIESSSPLPQATTRPNHNEIVVTPAESTSGKWSSIGDFGDWFRSWSSGTSNLAAGLGLTFTAAPVETKSRDEAGDLPIARPLSLDTGRLDETSRSIEPDVAERKTLSTTTSETSGLDTDDDVIYTVRAKRPLGQVDYSPKLRDFWENNAALAVPSSNTVQSGTVPPRDSLVEGSLDVQSLAPSHNKENPKKLSRTFLREAASTEQLEISASHSNDLLRPPDHPRSRSNSDTTTRPRNQFIRQGTFLHPRRAPLPTSPKNSSGVDKPSPRGPKIKIVLLGDPLCGKSWLVERYISNTLPILSGMHEISIHDAVATIDINTRLELEVWDYPGHDRSDASLASILAGVDCVLVCFDVGDKDSLENAREKWISEVKRSHEGLLPMIFVGCKADLMRDSQTSVDTLDAWTGPKTFDEMFAMRYLECSAKEDKGVAVVFETAAKAGLSSLGQQHRAKRKKSRFNLFASA